jgi:predicted deacylase
MKYEVPPFLSGEGRHVPFIHIAKRTPGAKEKLRVYIQAAIHGSEPAADQAAMALLGKMDANTTWAASLLDKMEILV